MLRCGSRGRSASDSRRVCRVAHSACRCATADRSPRSTPAVVSRALLPPRRPCCSRRVCRSFAPSASLRTPRTHTADAAATTPHTAQHSTTTRNIRQRTEQDRRDNDEPPVLPSSLCLSAPRHSPLTTLLSPSLRSAASRIAHTTQTRETTGQQQHTQEWRMHPSASSPPLRLFGATSAVRAACAEAYAQQRESRH